MSICFLQSFSLLTTCAKPLTSANECKCPIVQLLDCMTPPCIRQFIPCFSLLFSCAMSYPRSWSSQSAHAVNCVATPYTVVYMLFAPFLLAPHHLSHVVRQAPICIIPSRCTILIVVIVTVHHALQRSSQRARVNLHVMGTPKRQGCTFSAHELDAVRAKP